MSLNWDISKVKNWQKKMEKHSSTLNCLIWSTLVIGMGDLNEKKRGRVLLSNEPLLP